MDMIRHPKNNQFQWRTANPPFRRITAEQSQQWNQAGYFLLQDVFSAAELDAVTAEIDPMEQKTNAFLKTVEDKYQYIARADEVTFALHMVEKSTVARAFAKHPVFADLCLDLLGPDCRLYWDQAVYKKAFCPEEFPWHQDNGYTFVTPQDYLTCWVPLVDATLNNGCPWVVPGVHRQGTLSHWKTPLGWQCIQDHDAAVPIEAKAGDVVVFSSLTPHRTGPNTTSEDRKSYILQYGHDGAQAWGQGNEGVTQDHPGRQFIVVRGGDYA
ncbi:MAG: phytanoyl-CoA dioxygenase family protein [Gammaproteobacteria bacterium]|jgi:phytanoyl-CoA hydroxylase|nr:phytanoyl-CoA dioxygenase family protein [Gammaproteobacteria bacterium]